jgi:large subunit ribosomal protein L13
MKTAATKVSEIKREKHLIDLKGKILGRVASDIAKLLMGKAKPYFVRNLDCGDYVTVINAKDVVLTGKKEAAKKYYRYSGYPGGLRIDTAGELRDRKPTELIQHAVKGMLPQNKLRDKMLRRLTIYPESMPAAKATSMKAQEEAK